MRHLLLLIAMIVISIKALGVFSGGPVPLQRDSLGYWQLSTLVIQGDIFMMGDPIAYRTPGYPWFLAIVRLIGGNYSLWLIALIQSILYVGSIWFAAIIAQQITKLANAKLITTCCLLPAVSAIQYTTACLSETVFTFTLLVHLSSVLGYSQKPGAWKAVLLGMSYAILILIKPIALLLWIAHAALLFYYLIRSKKHIHTRGFHFYKKSHVIFALVTLLGLISPWLARNHLIFGKPLLTEFVGRNLWIVTFQDGSGAALPFSNTKPTESLQQRVQVSSVDVIPRSTWLVSNQLVSSGLNDAQTDQLMRRVALDAIAKNQMKFAEKTLRRCVNYWRCAHTNPLKQGGKASEFKPQYFWSIPQAGIEWLVSYRFSQSVLGNTALTGLLAVSLLLLLHNHPSRPPALWIAIIFLYFSVITGVFEIPDYRYRLIMEPLAGTTIGSAIATVISKRERTATPVQ